MCYTFNNFPQGMNQHRNNKNINTDSTTSDGYFFSSLFNFRPIQGTRLSDTNSDHFRKVKSVTGCGKNSGLQLIIDSQKMNNLFSKNMRSKGYHVFITVPGVVTSKIPFYVDPEFDGEHNFYLHGIHVIGVNMSILKT